MGVLVFFKVYEQGKYLPAGMSFYMFQIGAYLIDVFRGKTDPEEGFLAYAEQIMLFPKLLSGPIMEPAKLREQQHRRDRNGENVYEGIRILILGLALKVVLANRLGGLRAQPQIIHAVRKNLYPSGNQ